MYSSYRKKKKKEKNFNKNKQKKKPLTFSACLSPLQINK